MSCGTYQGSTPSVGCCGGACISPVVASFSMSDTIDLPSHRFSTVYGPAIRTGYWDFVLETTNPRGNWLNYQISGILIRESDGSFLQTVAAIVAGNGPPPSFTSSSHVLVGEECLLGYLRSENIGIVNAVPNGAVFTFSGAYSSNQNP